MWNSAAELVKKAKGIADLKYPNGYNKEQLIACSKEVYDGRTGGAFDAPIKTERDICNQRNAMANIDGHYPLRMTDCEVVEINGGCGLSCPVFARGDCDEFQDDMLRDLLEEEGRADAIKRLDEEAPDMVEYFNDYILTKEK